MTFLPVSAQSRPRITFFIITFKVAYGKREEFFMFACVMEATMIDKKMGDRSLQIEVSCGNAGNSIDGQLTSATGASGAGASGKDTDSVASANFDEGTENFSRFNY